MRDEEKRFLFIVVSSCDFSGELMKKPVHPNASTFFEHVSLFLLHNFQDVQRCDTLLSCCMCLEQSKAKKTASVILQPSSLLRSYLRGNASCGVCLVFDITAGKVAHSHYPAVLRME